MKSESSYQDFLADPTNFEGVDYEDPKAIAQWAQKIGEASGVELGSDYQEVMDSLSSGDVPNDIGGLDDL